MQSIVDAIGTLFLLIIRLWVRATGKRMSPQSTSWLLGPTGQRDGVGSEIYSQVAADEELTVESCQSDGGLLPSFTALTGKMFDANEVHPLIHHFYEHTADWELDAWAHWSLLFRPAGWILSFAQRRQAQLNFPLGPLDTSQGITSEIIALRDRNGLLRHCGWLRKLRATGRVIYAGFYSICQPPGYPSPSVKTVFPLPLGSSTVVLKPVAMKDGSFKLISQGRLIGEPGFYRLHHEQRGSRDNVIVRYIPALTEEIHVFVDPHDDSRLRTNHYVRLFGITMLTLHYKLARRERRSSDASADSASKPPVLTAMAREGT